MKGARPSRACLVVCSQIAEGDSSAPIREADMLTSGRERSRGFRGQHHSDSCGYGYGYGYGYVHVHGHGHGYGYDRDKGKANRNGNGNGSRSNRTSGNAHGSSSNCRGGFSVDGETDGSGRPSGIDADYSPKTSTSDPTTGGAERG